METHTGPATTFDAGKYEAHRELIDAVIAVVARHQHLPREVAEEFASAVWERLLESDTLSRFQGRSSLRTFLTVVIGNIYRDFRNQRWGKWRPSAEARRLGPLGLQLEILTVRDGYTFEEAVSILQTNYQCAATHDELLAIRVKLPQRAKRRMVGEEELEQIGVSVAHIEDGAIRDERRASMHRLRAALRRAVEELPPDDQLIVRLLFEDGFTVAQVAGALKTAQKPLYRRRAALLAEIRRKLEGAGVTSADLDECWPALRGDAL